MVDNITFELTSRNQTEIKLQHSTGETTVITFDSPVPYHTQEFYLQVLQDYLETNPDLTSEGLLGKFTILFGRRNLEIPFGVGTYKNEERKRIGERIKEIRESQKLDAKTLAMISGIDAANLCRIEQGRYSVGLDILSKIANALGYKLDFVKK